MLFSTDKQTLDDLSIFNKQGGNSIYAIFNRTATRGGAALLEEMFRHPLSGEQAINHRSRIIQYFSERQIAFPFNSSLFDAIESYLSNTDERTKLSAEEYSLGKRLGNLLAKDVQTATIYKGVGALLELLKNANGFIKQLEPASPYEVEKETLAAFLLDPAFYTVWDTDNTGKLSHAAIAGFDDLFRFRHRPVILKLLQILHQLDVYVSIAQVASEKRFTFPKALPKEKPVLTLQGVYHPYVKNAIPNTLVMASDSNVVFLTGANMAGKSTFMKSVSIALYLAHLGFPVPAAQMVFSVLDGIFTTINLPDNLGMGASHFYAEVLRVKKIAQELALGKRLFVLFDELFRGTNVKDAHEATVAIASAFAGKRDSLFVISTHIIEAGDELRKRWDNILFTYLPTRMKGNEPVYTYTLEQGITEDRHGMVIIRNEGILDILRGGHTAAQKKGQAKFIVDKQTLDDLNLPGRHRPYSIIGIFNQVKTHLGERLLDSLFQDPLTDPESINARANIFQYFQRKQLSFPFSSDTIRLVDNYLGMKAGSNWAATAAGVFQKKMLHAFVRDQQYEILCREQRTTIETLNGLRQFIHPLEADKDSPYHESINTLARLLSDSRWGDLFQDAIGEELPVLKVIEYDYLLRTKFSEEMQGVMTCLAELDVYIAVSDVARTRGFSYAQAYPKERAFFKASGLKHPALSKGVGNPIFLHYDSNTLFLTGANMAGKSTLMKSMGIAVYLAHIGFPVAADAMEFSIRDGLYSSINVADNLNLGYSHFYAEVQRVKTVAQQVSEGKDLVVIFDELFKGTNVKDAYDATLAVTESFSNYRNSCFVISTHIIEVGTALQAHARHIQFAYLPTVMEGTKPRYTFQLTEGITGDRHGMKIIENEKILQTIACDNGTVL
jgi:DNA mismatch repair ATPase MutS